MDRRDESNVDEFYKLGSLRDLREMSLEPSFVVTGNQPVVIRESLLPKAFLMAEGTVASSFELEEGARGMIGPFCLETIVTDQLEFKVFEISAHCCGLQPLRRRLALLGHQRAFHVDRPPHCALDSTRR